MGRDKAHLQLGGRTMLERIEKTALSLNWPVRVIERDLVPRRGPVGGVYTALKTTRASRVLFLSCDMPFVTAALLRELLSDPRESGCEAVFMVDEGDRAGFPFVLRTACLPAVSALLEGESPSLQGLAGAVRSRRLKAGPLEADLLLNVNTPSDWEKCKELLRLIPE